MAQTVGRQHKENLAAHLTEPRDQILQAGQTETLMCMNQNHHKHGDTLEEFGKPPTAGKGILCGDFCEEH